MRIAIISDIHANFPALKAVLNDIKSKKADTIYCLGDLVNFAGWDNEVIDEIRSHNITCVQGNHDEGIGLKKEKFPFSFSTDTQKAFGEASIKSVNQTITPSNRKFLKTLPSAIKLEYSIGKKPVIITMVHANPLDNKTYITAKAGDERLKGFLDKANADVLLMGHTHIPFHRAIFSEEENRKIYKHAVNVGSVGKPKHGDNRACYVTMEIDEKTSLNEPEAFRFEFHYVPYDVEKVIENIQKTGLSNAYDEFLRKGSVINLKQ